MADNVRRFTSLDIDRIAARMQVLDLAGSELVMNVYDDRLKDELLIMYSELSAELRELNEWMEGNNIELKKLN